MDSSIDVIRPSFTDLRDGLVLVEFPGVPDDAANLAAVALARGLAPLSSRGLRDAIPAARTLLLDFDPTRLSHAAVRSAAGRARPGAGLASEPVRTLEIPAVFDGEDLAAVAAAAGLSPSACARAFVEAEYRVAFLGFAPGFPYMTGVPERLRAPRLPTPRLRVPAGSVAVAGRYAGIYPSATPGGWRLLGRTSARLFDAGRTPPALFAAGDRVRFADAGDRGLPRQPPGTPADAAGALFRVARPGLWSAVVGAPRRGLASSGVPPGGPMDPPSAALANAAVGNPPDAGVLEIALDGPELEALAPCVVSVAGADLPVACGASPRGHGQPFAVAAGDRLTFGRTRKGMRAYLAVGGGLRETEDAGQTRRLEREGLLFPAGARHGSPAAVEAAPTPHEGRARLRAIPGPHAAMFTPASLDAFFAAEWRVSPQSDRRGLRLDGPRLEHAGETEVEPVGAAPGSVQVPGGGAPIVLGPDGPVTGGYPRIATVIGADLPLLGRAAPGDSVRFIPATLEEALAADRRGRTGGAGREYD